MGDTPKPGPPTRALGDLLSRLGRRERGLLLLAAGAWAAVVFGGCLLVAAGLLSVGAQRSTTLIVTGVLALVGLSVLAIRVVGGRWSQAADPLVQARRLEALRPALRGRLLAAVDHRALLEEGAKPAPAGVSKVLLQRAAHKAAAAVADVPDDAVVPAAPAKRALLFACVAGLALLVGDRLLPVGPFDALAVAFGGSAAAARIERGATEVAEDRAVVGDIVLRYIYPDYTGIDPVEVPNSDGTIHAPPGTLVQISARTADSFDAAALQVDEQDPTDAALTGGRDVVASLVVEGAGTWRLLLFSGKTLAMSPDYRIEVEDDAPPVVALLGGAPTTAAADAPLDIGWSVQDDFGVERVVLEVTRADGTVVEHPLRSPLDAPRQLSGGVPISPRSLGLSPGETVKMRVVAYDNDRLEGSKRGASTEVEMTVVGPKGQGRMMRAHYKQLRDALVLVLADFLVDPMPPATAPEAMARWVDGARKRLEPVSTLQAAQRQSADGSGLDGDLVREVMDSSARLFRFALTTWEPGSGRRVTDGDLSSFADLHAEAVGAQERAILTLDALVVQAAMQELAGGMEELAKQAQELAAISENAEAGELLARLDQIERMMASFERLSAQLAEGSLKEFLNPRVEETQSLMQEIRKAIAEGRLEDAREMMQQLAEQLQQMSDSLNSQMASRQQGEDQLGEQFKKTMDELAALEKDQRELAEKMEKAREEMGEGVAELMELWKKADGLAAEARAQSGKLVEAVGDAQGWRVDSIRWFEKLGIATAGVQDAVRARNAEGALERVTDIDTVKGLGMSRRLVDNEKERRRPPTEARPSTLDAASRSVDAAAAALDELAKVLEELLDKQEAESPEVQQAARQMAAQQAALRERQQGVGNDVKRIERAMPTADGGASESMQAAGEAMERATEALQQGEALSGEGHGRDAAERLGEAQRALQREMEQQQQMQQAMQEMQGEQEGGQKPDGDKEGGTSKRDQSFELPAPEAFRTPEAYRRALLEGMEADVPDEYRALKQRYYEELVRQ